MVVLLRVDDENIRCGAVICKEKGPDFADRGVGF